MFSKSNQSKKNITITDLQFRSSKSEYQNNHTHLCLHLSYLILLLWVIFLLSFFIQTCVNQLTDHFNLSFAEPGKVFSKPQILFYGFQTLIIFFYSYIIKNQCPNLFILYHEKLLNFFVSWSSDGWLLIVLVKLIFVTKIAWIIWLCFFSKFKTDYMLLRLKLVVFCVSSIFIFQK